MSRNCVGVGGAWLQDANVPGALDDEEPVAAVTGVADEERAREAARYDGIELDGGACGGREAQRPQTRQRDGDQGKRGWLFSHSSISVSRERNANRVCI